VPSDIDRPAVQAIVVDFDGTICPQDVSEEILRKFADPSWWEIDLRFQRGEIGSRECLTRQARLLEGSTEDMLAFALEHHSVEPTFGPFVSWAHDVGMEVAVASDGFGFYVEPMLRGVGIEGLPLHINRMDELTRELSFPAAHPVCVGCGVCKMQVVRGYGERLGQVAFVGEGHTDRYGALYADLVFAKKHLAPICVSDGVRYLSWNTFDDVRTGLEMVDEPPGAIAPDVCPGWTVPS
jgi:2-hydroxy-3-keto-5-methylthiopentenyl-1-phosphate phosphatase